MRLTVIAGLTDPFLLAMLFDHAASSPPDAFRRRFFSFARVCFDC
jgi:hypothetical protein